MPLTKVDSTMVVNTNSGENSVQQELSEILDQINTTSGYSTWGVSCVSLGNNNFGADPDFTGVENVAIGTNCLTDTSNGYANVAIGAQTIENNTSGHFNIGIGAAALRTNTTGYENIAVGTYANGYNTTGYANTAVATDTLRYNTTGHENTAVGVQAMYNNLDGSYNVAVGMYASRGVNNPPDEGPGTGPSYNYTTALGAKALFAATGSSNTAIGFESGYNTTGSFNTYLGAGAGSSVVSGAYNVFLGYNAGATVNTATNCVAIGDSAFTTGNNGIAIGSGSSAGANEFVAGNDLTFYVRPSADVTTSLGTSGRRWTVVYAQTGSINTSDANEKTEIRPLEYKEKAVALAIKARIKAFKFKDSIKEKGDLARIHFGVLAQDVKEAFEAEELDPCKYGVFCSDIWKDESGVEHTRLGVRYDELFAFIIGSI